jgi:hypothetical protein
LLTKPLFGFEIPKDDSFPDKAEVIDAWIRESDDVSEFANQLNIRLRNHKLSLQSRSVVNVVV